MLFSKFKKLICVVLTLLCCLPCLFITAGATDDDIPHQPYPCYCEECVQLWNEQYNGAGSYLTSLTGSNESLNGKNMIIFYFYSFGTGASHIYLYFYDSLDINNRIYTFSNVYTYSINCSDGPISINLSSVSTDNYTDIISLELSTYDYILNESWSSRPRTYIYYFPSDDLTSLPSQWVDKYSFTTVYSYFTYPSTPLTDTEVFEQEFTPTLMIWLKSLYDFVTNNTLVLLIFSLGLFGCIVTIFKIC